MRALASHQCGPGSIPGLSVLCGFSLFLFLVHAQTCVFPVFPLLLLGKNQISNYIRSGLLSSTLSLTSGLEDFTSTPRVFDSIKHITQCTLLYTVGAVVANWSGRKNQLAERALHGMGRQTPHSPSLSVRVSLTSLARFCCALFPIKRMFTS